MESVKKIGDLMTPCPITVRSTTTIMEALKIMEEGEIRHLPVAEGNHVIGILSDREIKRYETLIDTTRTLAVDVMTPDPFTVKKDAPIQDVVSEMAKNKFGSTIVVGNSDQVVGIFTTTDALELLAKTIS